MRCESNRSPMYVLIHSLVSCVLAVGCPDIIAAPGVSVERRSGESAIVRCNGSHTTSYLVCRGTVWSGDVVSSCQVRRESHATYSSYISTFLSHSVHILISFSERVRF